MNQNAEKKEYCLKCGHQVFLLHERTHVMGILNVTPDSFSDGGLYHAAGRAVERALEIEDQGADFIDIGGESTRPGAMPVPVGEELERIIPVIEALSAKINIPISIDTRKAPVAEAAVRAGACMVNDISGLRYDPEMASTVAKLEVPVVIMHSRDDPVNMQSHVDYKDIISDIYRHLNACVQHALDAGIKSNAIIIDPGIGFGKRVSDNFLIIKNLNRFTAMGYPVLIGVSRKAFIGKTLSVPESERLMGTASAVTASVLYGAHLVRVHDVKAMKQVVTIADQLREK